MRIAVVVALAFEGVHSWPECPLPDVAFLRHPHRHEFRVTARKLVSHEEREVEVIMLKRSMAAYCRDELAGPHSMSCETMARMLAERFCLASCQVLEDGENGAEVWS